MKKFGKVLLALVVVGLVISFVGCGGFKLNEEEHKANPDNKLEHTWVAEYETDNYVRSALQFGTGKDKLTEATVNVKMKYPQYGKSGVIFGLTFPEYITTDEEGKEVKEKRFSYYLLGVGEVIGTNTLDWYIQRCDNLTSLSGGNNSSETADTSNGAFTTDIVDNTVLSVPHKSGEAIEYDVKVVFVEDETMKELYKDTLLEGFGSYTVQLVFVGEVVAEKSFDNVPGTIASYGMISPKAEKPQLVDTTWTVQDDYKGTVNLSAVEE